MKPLYIFFSTCIFFFLIGENKTTAQIPDFVWAKQSYNPTPNLSNTGSAIACDSLGNTYTTGNFVNTTSFGSSVLASSGNTDVFLAKYDASGTNIWAVQAGGIGEDRGLDIAVDKAGNSFILGTFWDTVTFNTITLTSSTSVSSKNFLAKYNAAGNIVWVKEIASGGNYGSLVLDSLGNIYVTSQITEIINPFVINTSVFVGKYDQTGNVIWLNSGISSHSAAQGLEIGIDSFGNCYIAGEFAGNLAIGSTTLVSTTLWGSSGSDIFLAKFDGAGNHIWAQNFGSWRGDNLLSFAVDKMGNSYMAGTLGDTTSFGSVPLDYHGFLSKINTLGGIEWARNISKVSFTDMLIGSDEHVYMAGYFNLSVNLGSYSFTSNGAVDIIIAKYSKNGSEVWAKQAGSYNDDYPSGIASNLSGVLFLTGNFRDHCLFGNYPLYTPGVEVFIANMALNPLGVQNPADGSELNIYPNPNNGNFKIDFVNQKATHAEIEITDLTGRKIYFQVVKAKDKSLSETIVLNAAKGIYMLHIKNGSKYITRKIIVQ